MKGYFGSVALLNENTNGQRQSESANTKEHNSPEAQ